MMSHSNVSDAKDGEFQFVAGANDAKLSTCEYAPLPQALNVLKEEDTIGTGGSVNEEYPPESSLRGKKRKRGLKAILARITEANKRFENEIRSLNNKCDDELKSLKRQNTNLDHAKGLMNWETNMVDMLCNALVTCQICNDRNHTAAECPRG